MTKFKQLLIKQSPIRAYLPYFCLALFFILNLWLVWPGQMTPDSYTQYEEALANSYTAIHPPLMSFLWHMFIYIYPGPGLILLLHLLLLYSACFIFMRTFKNSSLKFYYLLYPLLPAIFFYSSMIWKDVGFALAYLALSSGITYFIIRQKKPTNYQYLILITLLIYGSAVKFQALYTAPGLLLGICFIVNNFKFNFKTWCLAISGYLLLYISIVSINNILETPTKNTHRWQYVKIYDLAGISLELNKPVFPDYILQAKSFDFAQIKQKFNYERVDDLVFFADSPIPRAISDIERQALLKAWRTAVYQHPLAYLKHRWHNWMTIIFAKPLEKLDTLDFKQFKGLPAWITNLNQSDHPQLSNSQKFIIYINKFIFIALKYFRYLLSFIFIFIFILLSLFYSLFKLKNNYGYLLFMFSLTGLLLVLALFPFTMASALRYVYMPICLAYAALPIAYMLYKTDRH